MPEVVKKKRRMQYLDVGEEAELNAEYTFIPSDIDFFCRLTSDIQPFFINDEAGRASGFKGRVAPGAMVFSVFEGLGAIDGELFRDVLIHLTSDKVKFTAPVYPYDKIRAKVKVLDKHYASDGKRVAISYGVEVRNQDNVVVMTFNNTCMFKKD